jgi:hypothetical protein
MLLIVGGGCLRWRYESVGEGDVRAMLFDNVYKMIVYDTVICFYLP